MRTSLLLVLFASILALCALSRADDGGSGRLGQPDKPGSANVETCLKRAVQKAREHARDKKTSFSRVTVTPSDTKEYAAFLIACEFKDGSVGLFQGGSEEKTDQWILVEKDNSAIVLEAVNRR